ncbi:MAG TPA: acyltransferase [Solirubrobacteraceae bacterium]|nr:acyltransferase [Solirubrobacteraceae bacterium]
MIYTKVRGYPPLDELVERGLVLGRGVNITRDVVLDPAHCHLIEIGDRTTLGPEVLVLAHDASTKRHIGYTRIARVRIGTRVFVGARAVILPGVTIGDDAIIGAGSVVSRSIAPGMVAVGAPAREIMTTQEYVERHAARLEDAPTYPGEGWTHRRGMTAGHPERMVEDLADTDGYIQ